MNCPHCNVPLMPNMSVCPKCKYDTHTSDGGELHIKWLLEHELEHDNNLTEAMQKHVEEKQMKSEALSKILITSGFNFDGYKITKYSGYISGDDAVEIPRSGFLFTTNNSQNLTDALVKIRRVAIRELKEAAYDLGCNAVIGVDFDYLTLEPEHGSGLFNGASGAGTVYEPYIICVTANGNAVVIEKD